MKKLFVSLAVLLLMAGSVFGQGSVGVHGKLFGKAEAEKLFGPVQIRFSIDKATLESYLKTVKDYVIIKASRKGYAFIDEARMEVFPVKGTFHGKSESLIIYSVSKFKELLQAESSTMIDLEIRPDKITVSNGSTVLELGGACPPLCPCPPDC